MKNISKTLLLTVAMTLGLMTPGIPSAKATDSCNTTTAAQPIVVYDPFLAMQADMMRMNLEMNRMMQTAFSAAPKLGAGGNYSSVSLETTPKEYRIAMTAPGADEKDLKVSVSANHTLTIQSTKDLVQKTSTGETHSSGSFTQMMSLPADADTDHMQTSYKDGEYTVTVPRKANAASMAHQPEQGLGI
jgi:HSP20 family molecular chaperone IbpA